MPGYIFYLIVIGFFSFMAIITIRARINARIIRWKSGNFTSKRDAWGAWYWANDRLNNHFNDARMYMPQDEINILAKIFSNAASYLAR